MEYIRYMPRKRIEVDWIVEWFEKGEEWVDIQGYPESSILDGTFNFRDLANFLNRKLRGENRR